MEFFNRDGILEKIAQLQREVCEATAAKAKAEEDTAAKVKAVEEVTATATELRARCGEYESQKRTMQAEITTLKQQLNQATAIAHSTVEQDTAAKQDLMDKDIARTRRDDRGAKERIQDLEKEVTRLNREYRKASQREESLAVFLFDDDTPCRIRLTCPTRKPSATERGRPRGAEYQWNERRMHWVENGQCHLFPPVPSDVKRFAEARMKAKNALAQW
jgi:DNA repair exonuclease SbcCD ATPase subunit